MDDQRWLVRQKFRLYGPPRVGSRAFRYYVAARAPRCEVMAHEHRNAVVLDMEEMARRIWVSDQAVLLLDRRVALASQREHGLGLDVDVARDLSVRFSLGSRPDIHAQDQVVDHAHGDLLNVWRHQLPRDGGREHRSVFEVRMGRRPPRGFRPPAASLEVDESRGRDEQLGATTCAADRLEGCNQDGPCSVDIPPVDSRRSLSSDNAGKIDIAPRRYRNR
jgi:hypothetical protein